MPRGVYNRKTTARTKPPEIPAAPLPEPPLPATGAIRVVLVKKRALGTTPEEQEIAWPPSWRLPQAGEAIVLDRAWTGFIEYVAFDLNENLIRCNLR